jgi:hypothetical protein
MSYLAYEFDALEQAPNVARATGISEDTAIAGLARMWRHCWRTKTDRVTAVALRGFFGADVADALVIFGFLERVNSEVFRVKGAERYLRIDAARQKGGHAAKRHLIPGARQKMSAKHVSPEPAQRLSRLQPRVSPEGLSAGSGLALGSTANSEQLLFAGDACASPLKGKRSSRQTHAPNPRHTPLKEKLKAEFELITGQRYGDFGGRDAKGVSMLISLCSEDEEILRRWRLALRGKYDRPRNIHDFALSWNRLAKTQEFPPPLKSPTAGRAYDSLPVRETGACVTCGQTAESKTDKGWQCYRCLAADMARFEDKPSPGATP